MSAKFKIEKCEACKQPIIRTEDANGRPTRVNAEPEKYGNLALEDRGRPLLPLTRMVPAHLAFGRTDLRTKHTTCRAPARSRGRIPS